MKAGKYSTCIDARLYLASPIFARDITPKDGFLDTTGKHLLLLVQMTEDSHFESVKHMAVKASCSYSSL